MRTRPLSSLAAWGLSILIFATLFGIVYLGYYAFTGTWDVNLNW